MTDQPRPSGTRSGDDRFGRDGSSVDDGAQARPGSVSDVSASEAATDATSPVSSNTHSAAPAERSETDEPLDGAADVTDEPHHKAAPDKDASMVGHAGRFVREVVIIVVIALIASALLRAFVVQAFFVPSGSMLPEIQLNDRILVSRIGEIDRGEVVVFEDPGGWIPGSEQAPAPGPVRSAFEFIGVLPASGHEHLVKRVAGLPGDHVVCCDGDGRLTINDYPVDESAFLFEKGERADNVSFDVVVPKEHIFVLGDNRYVSGDSSRHIDSGDPFIPMDLVTGRAFAVAWPTSNAHILRIPDAYDDVPDGAAPPDEGVITPVPKGQR